MINIRQVIHPGVMAAALALALLAGNCAAAARDTLKLRASISVAGEIVRIGDLFENAGSAARIPVFRSPSPGHSGVLTASRIVYALRGHGLHWDNPYGIREIAVHREGRRISLDDIEMAIRDQLADLAGHNDGDNLEIEFDRDAEPLVVPVDSAAGLHVLHADYEPHSERFVAVVSSSPDASGEFRRKYTGHAFEVAVVPVMARTVGRGERITRADVEMSRIKQSAIPGSALREEADIVGMVSRRMLRAGAVVRTRDVERPKVVRKSDLVTVVYTAPGLQLTTKATAMESGGKGDVITVMNPRSRRIIEAVVTGPNLVAALASGTQHTAALDQPANRRTADVHARYVEE